MTIEKQAKVLSGGGAKFYPGQISIWSNETYQIMRCSRQQSFYNKYIYKNMGFLIQKIIGKEVSELSERLFYLLSTMEKTVDLRASVLVNYFEGLLPTFSLNAINSPMT